MPPETDLTPLTQHPTWKVLRDYVLATEREAISRLRISQDPTANLQLIWISRLKADLRTRSENKELWTP